MSMIIIIFSKGGAKKAPKATTMWQPHQDTTAEHANMTEHDSPRLIHVAVTHAQQKK